MGPEDIPRTRILRRSITWAVFGDDGDVVAGVQEVDGGA